MSTATQKAVTLNNEQQLYVIPCGEGYSSFGYDNCFNHAKQLADILGQTGPAPQERGTLELYERYQTLVQEYGRSPRSQETYFSPNTSPEIKNVLEEARKTGRRVRWFYGDTQTGRSWLEEHDVEGTIGRSMGPLREPLGIGKRSDHGGGALLTNCIVRLIDARTKGILYSHPQFHLPPAKFYHSAEHPDHPICVDVDGKSHARFASLAEASEWITHLTGTKPGTRTPWHTQLGEIALPAGYHEREQERLAAAKTKPTKVAKTKNEAPAARKIALVYQAGIAHVYEVDSFSPKSETRNARRLTSDLKSDFRSCENLAQGMAMMGATVKSFHCNMAGSITDQPWSTKLDEAPFSDQMKPLFAEGGKLKWGIPESEDESEDESQKP